MENGTILVTGATGYVGARLVTRLLAKGYRVRATGRSLDRLRKRPWAIHPGVELFPADVIDPASIAKACEGCAAAYYLVHSMMPGEGEFEEKDREAARNMARAAGDAGMSRLIYLGGLGEENPALSRHLRSRSEVAEILSAGKTPVTILRAAMILGAGSASFEILRYLVDRLPVIITPKWVSTECQPIGIRNVLDYLVGCLETPGHRRRHLRHRWPGGRHLPGVDAPLRPRGGASAPARDPGPGPLAAPELLLDPPRHTRACGGRPAAGRGAFQPGGLPGHPDPGPDPREAFDVPGSDPRRAGAEELPVPRSGSTPRGGSPGRRTGTPATRRGRGERSTSDTRRLSVRATPAEVWERIEALGGKNGWYTVDWLWSLRGFLDRLCGGIGMRRGNRERGPLSPGAEVDFWRVVSVTPQRELRLVAEMKLPGDGVLAFRLRETDPGTTQLTQTAQFLPRGLGGMAYWAFVDPFHRLVFPGLILGIARRTGKPIVSGPDRLD